MRYIYVKRLGSFTKKQNSAIEVLKEFIFEYFRTEVRELGSRKLEKLPNTNQINAKSMIEFIAFDAPKDALIVLAITNEDLKTEDTNWVYGVGCKGLAVVSLARMVNMWLFKKLTAHELGHAYGLPHCDNRQCLMHYENSEEEALKSSIELCKKCKEMLAITKLINFVVKAKRNTYASENTIKNKMPDGSILLVYAENDLVYIDRYKMSDNNTRFTGEEQIIREGNVIWRMKYEGSILEDATMKKIDTKEIYRFLRKALRNVSPEKPYRGTNINEGKFTYINNVDGTFNCFEGHEVIKYDNVRVYTLVYSGGIQKNK